LFLVFKLLTAYPNLMVNRKTTKQRRQRAERGNASAGNSNRFTERSVTDFFAPRPVEHIGGFMEVKSFDGATGAATWTVATPAAIVYQLSAVAQGSASNQRVGDEIVVHGIELGYACATPTLAQTNNGPASIRMILIQWNQDNASVSPTGSTVLQADASPVATICPFFQGAIRQKDFSVLFDRCVVLSPAVSSSNAGDCSYRAERHTFPFPKGLSVDYNSGVTTGNGNIFLIVAAGVSQVATPVYPQFAFSSRILYTDA
jgi:hypothetical protein